jgi:P-type E1-E2 ATPase
LTALGATGLEDALQEDVAECISEFKKARIKVWMLTGDKEGTALSIGEACGIIQDGS